MCNRLHEDFKKIKQEGFGYKIFAKKDSPCFGNRGRDRYRNYNKIDSRIEWDMPYACDGFCFFTSKKEAIRLLKFLQGDSSDYNFHYIKRIQYWQGLGKHIENNIVNGEVYVTAICKEFKILELVER